MVRISLPGLLLSAVLAFVGVVANAEEGLSLQVTPKDGKAYLEDLARRLGDHPAVQQTLREKGPEAAFEVMNAEMPQDSTDAKGWALLGELALAAHQPKPAEMALERAVLLDPKLAGAWVDLSLAHLELGEAQQARQYLEYVQSEFAPSPAIHAVLSQLESQAGLLLEAKERWHFVASAGGGYDSNANNGLLTNSLILTAGADLLPLTLNPYFLARGSSYALAGIEGQLERSLGDSDWTLSYGFALRQKEFTREAGFSTTEAMAQIQASHPAEGGGDWLVGSQLDNYLLGGSEFLADWRFTAAKDLTWGNCHWAPGIELEERRNFLDFLLSGQVWWVFGQTSCQRHDWSWGATFRYGYDQAVNDRVGGDTDRAEGYFYLGKNIKPDLQARATVGYSWAQDRIGYNPLLENNAIRHLAHWLTRLELVQRWSNRWEGVATVERNVIDSNLVLFQQNEWLGSLAIRRYF
jgi:hypothetical protein